MSRPGHIIGPQLSTSSQSFNLGDQIRAFSKVVERRIDYVHRNLSIMLFTAIVYDTPVDTGLARGSWWPSKNEPIMGGAQRTDKAGTEVVRDIQEVCMSANVGEVLWMMNNVEYIVELEYGWSTQSPEGMVRINVARIQQYVKEVIASAKEVK